MQTLVQQGWQCPCCQKVYSPTTPMCFYCPPKVEVATSTAGVEQGRCNQELKMLGKAYPRTCHVCGFGPCKTPVVAQEKS